MQQPNIYFKKINLEVENVSWKVLRKFDTLILNNLTGLLSPHMYLYNTLIKIFIKVITEIG